MNTPDLSTLPASLQPAARTLVAQLTEQGGTRVEITTSPGPLSMTHLLAQADELPPGASMAQALVDGTQVWQGANALGKLISAKNLWNSPPAAEELRGLLNILVFSEAIDVTDSPEPPSVETSPTGWRIQANTLDGLSAESAKVTIVVPRDGSPLTVESSETSNVVSLNPSVALTRALDDQDPLEAKRALHTIDDRIYDGGAWTSDLLNAVARAATSGNHAVRGEALGLLPDSSEAALALGKAVANAPEGRRAETLASAKGLASPRLIRAIADE